MPFVSTKRCQKNKKQLKNFENIYDWFVSNKVSTQTGGDKIKSILFASMRKIKSIRKLNVNFKNIKTKQHLEITHLGCVLDDTLPGELVNSTL